MDNREQQLNDAVAVIEWFREHPDIPLPTGLQEFNIYEWNSKDEATRLVRAFGSAEKSGDDDLFYLTKRIGNATIRGIFSRGQVCERVVVGTKEIETEEADPVAVAALPMVKVKKQIEIVEWQCPELLAAE